METKEEENVEYHIEIQKCEDEGAEANNGEVMYVLDFGGADIPENLAMSIAQWAADRSLPIGDGASSFVVQNNVGLEDTQIMQVDTDNRLEGEEAQQVIHVKMEDGSDYIMDTTAATDGSVIYNLQDEVIHIEKPNNAGRIELKTPPEVGVLDFGSSKLEIQNPDGTSSYISRKPFVVRNVNENKQDRKTPKSGQSVNNKNSSSANKIDRLPITPFLKGKTPVMLVVGEDGKLSTDISSVQSSVKFENIQTATPFSMNAEQDGIVKSEPMILDFTTEKIKLENPLAASIYQGKKESLLTTSPRAARSLLKPKDSIMIDDRTESLPIEMTEDSNFSVTEDDERIKVDEEDSTEGVEQTSSLIEDVNVTAPEPEVKEEKKHNELSISKECLYEDCDFKSSDPDIYSVHLEEKHDDKFPNCCFVCDKKFKLNLTLKIHQLIHMKDARPRKKKRGPYGSRDKFYACPLCSEKRKLKREIQLHVSVKHDIEKTYTCESCKFICFSAMELEEHKETVLHRMDKRNYCEICKQLFTNIYQHKAAVHSTNRPFQCHQCGYSAKTKSSLRYHMVTHLTTKDWACESCPYKTTSERRLKRHMKIHDPNKKHVCNLCSFATHDAYEYKRHFIKVHSKSKSYNCKFCDQKFDKHHEIRLHLMFEHNCNDAFFCNFCDYTCATRAAYKDHIQTHYGKNKHVCEICGFTGRYKTHYRRHMLTHSKEKPFECTICGKRLSEASNLRRHMLTHTEDKPLACSVCGYRCKIRSRLMNHMKTHSELRPFACHLCKYTTKFNGNLMKHLENHAKYKPYKCQFCPYSCNERNKLKRHMTFRHKGQIEPKQEAVNDVSVSAENVNVSVNINEQQDVGDKELIALPSKDQNQILLVPKEELVIMQGDEERVVLPVDENGMVLASNQEELVAQLESGNVILTVEGGEGAPESHAVVEGLRQSMVGSIGAAEGTETESMIIYTTTGGEVLQQ